MDERLSDKFIILMAFWKLLARGILEQVGYDVVHYQKLAV
jgi:hypothetical protein